MFVKSTPLRRSPLMVMLLTLLLLTAARPLHAESPPSSDPPRVTVQQEIELGNEVAAKVRKQFGGTWNSPQELARVKRIAFKLFEVSDRHDVAALRDNFSVELLDTSTVNAMCVPGGHTFVTRGLVQLGLDDDELACVMGHEICHASRRHGARNLEASKLLQRKVDQMTKRDILRKMAQVPILIYLFKHFDPQLEFEADYYGAIYAHHAGYNPQGMVTLFERFDKMERGGKNDSRLKRLLSSLFDNHPPTPDRIKRAQSTAQKLKAGENMPTTPVPVYQ